jgi:hypothetical protein
MASLIDRFLCHLTMFFLLNMLYKVEWWIIVNHELQRMQKETVVAHIKVLSQQLHGDTEENLKNL